MNFELISIIVLIVSFLGMAFLVTRKIPKIVELPDNPNFIPGKELSDRLKKKTKDVIKKRHFNIQIFLQKTLSRIRILILKLDNKVAKLSQKLKQKTRETKESIDFEEEDLKNKFKEKEK